MVLSDSNLGNPFGELGSDLSESELRETAYEILIGACRSSGGTRPLTFVSSSAKNVQKQPSISSAPSLQRSLTSTAASKMKKALGLKKTASCLSDQRAVTIGELIRVQMRVSEQTDSRVRRALLRIAATQLGRRIESLVLPLELLQQYNSADFSTEKEYEAWQQRNLKVLEAGLLKHPYLPLDMNETAAQQLRQIIRKAFKRPIETGKHSESMRILRDIVMSLACRSHDGTEMCHWADGVPLNFLLYQILLEACFDINDSTSVIEEVDEVLELLKKTWVVLGINQMFHNLCFSWVLFHRYVTTGQVETDLLFAADNLLLDLEKDARATKDPTYSMILSSTMTMILNWAEKELLLYHDTFFRGNINVMESVLSLSASAAKILENVSKDYRRNRNEVDDSASGRVETYIRSSLRKAFSQLKECVYLSRRAAKHQQNPPPFLSILAQEIIDLAYNEKEIYSPILKKWHPLATSVAAATLHVCYGKELKQFISGNSELTPDSLQVLIAADKLEKDLVHMAVEDLVDSEDGGKSIIREMIPYETEGVMSTLIKSWIQTRLERLKELVDRNLQQETWNPQETKEQFASSAVEFLHAVTETLEGFFMLPIPQHSASLSDLLSGLDRCLQQYILAAKFGCGSRSDFIPAMPALTRCAAGSKLPGVFRKNKSIQRRKSQKGTTNGTDYLGIPQLCVRINTLHHVRKYIDVLEKKTVNHLKNNGSTHSDNIIVTYFELSRKTCVEGVQSLCVATAYKVIFHDLSHVLWDGLYIGEVSSSRIQPFLKELEQYLEIISSTVHDRVRTRLITDVMKAAFEGFLLVLLAGGPSRAFNLQDSAAIEEDFRLLTDLFWSGGDGLPTDLIEKSASTVRFVLPLFRTETGNLIEEFKTAIMDEFGTSAKSRLPLPPTTGQWDPNETNTILRVLCHRNDKLATNFLKKAYNLPKEL